MKYSVLLVGKNNAIMEEFFTHLRHTFECLSCSIRSEDILNHLKYYTPDAFVYCLSNEGREAVNQILPVESKLEKRGIPLVIVGSYADCWAFNQHSVDAAELTLTKPLSAGSMEARLLDFLKKRESHEEERRQRRIEQAEAEKHGNEEPRQETGALYGEAQEEQIFWPGIRAKNEKKHILVIDDDPLMLKMIKEHLHEIYNVATAINGKIAMKFLSNRTTDLILLDYEMPVENGPAVLEKLHANEATRNIPVVFLTGITEKEKIQKALVLKPQGYLLKPIDHEKLMETIEKLVG